MRFVVSLLFAFTLLLPAISEATILHTRSAPVITGSFTAPDQAKLFLRREPDFAKKLADGKSTGLLHYDEKLAALLEQVNTEGNAAITWTSDPVAWGEPDNWDFPCEVDHKLYDDCDSYTLWKTRRLMELGLPSSPLLFTLTYDETGGFHAILVVATDAGDFVLDNRMKTVKRMEDLIKFGYNPVSRVGTGDDFGGEWVRLRPSHAIPFSLNFPEKIPPVPMCHPRPLH